ncbi:uncharacterized protein BDW70DRAFT_108047 [Aspergillus foveolatus]|uniref:uncharacterized protein n=1 Tax=Aspergillus foveolatus TaxID=210207 RepID=UPI003CCD8B21
MEAILVTEFGDPSVLSLADVPTPTAQPGQVLIKIHLWMKTEVINNRRSRGLHRSAAPCETLEPLSYALDEPWVLSKSWIQMNISVTASILQLLR